MRRKTTKAATRRGRPRRGRGRPPKAESKPEQVPQSVSDPYIVVYADDTAAFRVREFRHWTHVARFIGEHSLGPDDCRVIQGRIVKGAPPNVGPTDPYTDEASALDASIPDTELTLTQIEQLIR